MVHNNPTGQEEGEATQAGGDGRGAIVPLSRDPSPDRLGRAGGASRTAGLVGSRSAAMLKRRENDSEKGINARAIGHELRSGGGSTWFCDFFAIFYKPQVSTTRRIGHAVACQRGTQQT